MLDSVTNTVASNAGPIKTPTHRKINKLMMEKRRRTRINNCLSELKTLVLKALKKDGEQFSKLEKVDILEMTVKYLRFLHQQQQVNITSDSLGGKYRVPLDVEVMRYMNSEEARSRLTDHISKCVRVSNGSPTNTQTPPTPTAAHQQITSHQQQINTTQQQTPVHIRQSQSPQTSPLGDNTTHIVLPIASKQSESSLMMSAVPESPYKTLTVSYINSSPISCSTSSPSTHVINTPVNSLTAITAPQNTITSPSIVHMKALVSDSHASNGCYVSTVPVYVGSISEAKPTSATLAGFYTHPLKRHSSPEPIKELPLWRPW